MPFIEVRGAQEPQMPDIVYAPDGPAFPCPAQATGAEAAVGGAIHELGSQGMTQAHDAPAART